MAACFFATDIHGARDRYEKLLRAIRETPPEAVFLGGDLLPTLRALAGDPVFAEPSELVDAFDEVRADLGSSYPRVFLILGNDDPRALEPEFLRGEDRQVWTCLNGRKDRLGDHAVYGYPFVPPTPFLNKDWERYDVSRYVDPGCVSPEEGYRSVEVAFAQTRYRTIAADLEKLTADDDLSAAIFLFHTPPYKTKLDLTGLAGQQIDHAPLDPHVGSIAVRRLIEKRQPLITLHGHIHGSTRRTGSFTDRIGATLMIGGAHDGPELAVVRFDPDEPENAVRELL
jgi:uncharacterized protein